MEYTHADLPWYVPASTAHNMCPHSISDMCPQLLPMSFAHCLCPTFIHTAIQHVPTLSVCDISPYSLSIARFHVRHVHTRTVSLPMTYPHALPHCPWLTCTYTHCRWHVFTLTFWHLCPYSLSIGYNHIHCHSMCPYPIADKCPYTESAKLTLNIKHTNHEAQCFLVTHSGRGIQVLRH